MANMTTVTIASGSGDSVTVVLTSLNTNQVLLQKSRIDSADPAAPANGDWWIRSDVATEYGRHEYHNGAKVSLWTVNTSGTHLHVAVQDVDINGNEIVNCRIKNLATGSLTAVGAAVEGQIEWDSTLELHVSTGSARSSYLTGPNIDATTLFPIPCTLNVANAGTPATASVATRLGGWLMDATAEELNVVPMLPMPDGWTTAHDLFLDVYFQLGAAETAADDVDMDCDWNSLTPASGDDTTTPAVTAATLVEYDIGATAINQYDIHKLRITIDHDDVTNSVAVGDSIFATLQRNTAGGAGNVAGVIVYKVILFVPIWRVEWL